MVYLKFQIDKEADLSVWLRFLRPNHINSFGHSWLTSFSKDFLDQVFNKTEEEQKLFISNHIEKYYIKENLEKFQIKSYNKVKEKLNIIIERLEKLYNQKLPVKNIVVKYETFTCCPYIWQGKESDTFGLYFAKYVIDGNTEIKVFCHEVMHLFFHYYYFDYCLSKGLSENQTKDLKEAVTVLLNLEFKDLIEKKDNGYPNHQELRQIISEEWQKQEEKNFQKLLDVVIEKIKSLY